MVLVSPAENSILEATVEEGTCYIFDPEESDCDVPPSENQPHLCSDMWFNREDYQ